MVPLLSNHPALYKKLNGSGWLIFAWNLEIPQLSYLSVVISTKKEEFANNLSRCVATQTLDTCLAKILEDLRSLMPTGIPELGLRPTEPLQIENIKFKTRPGIGVQIDSEFSNVRQLIEFYLDLNWPNPIHFSWNSNWKKWNSSAAHDGITVIFYL